MSVDYSDPDYWNVPPSDEMQSDPQHTKRYTMFICYRLYINQLNLD